MRPPLVIYHKNCMDGAGAALAAWIKFGDEGAEYRPAQYGDKPPVYAECADRDVYVLDFSYKRDELCQMNAAAKSLTVLDHHETAQANCEGLDFCKFDMTKSGAVLAWEHFFPVRHVPELLQYIQDRDLWTWKLPHSKQISAALAAMGAHLDFRKLQGLQAPTWHHVQRDGLIREGTAILRYQEQLVESITRKAWEVIIGGHQVLAVNSPVLQSEVGEALAQGRPFGVVWYVSEKGEIVFSLRSRKPTGVNVAEVAKLYGGGGHAGAAGFALRGMNSEIEIEGYDNFCKITPADLLRLS